MVNKYSLAKNLVASNWFKEGFIINSFGDIYKAFEAEPIPSGNFEENYSGSVSDTFYQKLSELLTRLPNHFDGHIILTRKRTDFESLSFKSRLLIFEKVQKEESYSHFQALLKEIGLNSQKLTLRTWEMYLKTLFGSGIDNSSAPDIYWSNDGIKIKDNKLRAISLTELPQVTWRACLQTIFESEFEFVFSLKMQIPDRRKIKNQLETKRRVSHALAISSSLEVKNIESNSVLNSSEETLERILVNKETLFEISASLMVLGGEQETLKQGHDLERQISGVGNAGLFIEGVGVLPVVKSHIPGEAALGIRKLPILSENLVHVLPLTLDYSRLNDESALKLVSKSSEVSHFNLFSAKNLNFNSFICGASGSGKSFLMNSILVSNLKDEPNTRICIFDVGGSYQKIVNSQGGQTYFLNKDNAGVLISSYFSATPVRSGSFFNIFLETLCGSGNHITHSHKIAIDDLLKQMEGKFLSIERLIFLALDSQEKFYHDIAHWLKPYAAAFKETEASGSFSIESTKVSAFDFKELEADPVLQKATILVLTDFLWQDLIKGKYSRTLIVFDEVWKFFANSKGFLEEMYRTLRKYKAGIVSITQNLADYGDESFAKMLFTNSFTKVFLQNGASGDFLKNTFDLSLTDITRALSVQSKKPDYSEFFVLTPNMSQIFRLFPTKEFYELANTENIAIKTEGGI